MNSILKKLAFCALLGASMNAHAIPTLFPNGDFASAPLAGSWKPEFGGGTTTFNYPTSGGSGGSGGYGTMNNSGGWGIWIGNNGAPFTPLSSLGLTAGNGYTFFMDMKIEAGAPNNNLGRIKLEWAGVGGQAGEFSRTLIGDGTTWERYTYDIIIPVGATGFKVVPVVSDNSFVGFDNIGFESVPYYVAPLPPPPPTDVVLQDPFTVASTNWMVGAPPPGGTSSVTWSSTEGNPPGSTIIAAANPAGAGANVAFTYTRTGVDFGTTGPVRISFDAKGTALVATALHVRYNGNFVGAIQGSFNDTTYTTYTQTFNLNQGFETNTFTLVFELATGAVAGSGGSFSIDNIKVLSNLPDALPFSAEIAMGTLVGWAPTAAQNIYQPEESADNSNWTNLGPSYTGTSVSSVFDPTPAAFYRVQQTVPVVEEAAFNGGFEDDGGSFPDEADGWFAFGPQPAERTLLDFRTGIASMRIMATATVADPMADPPTYAAGVSGFEQNTTNAGGTPVVAGKSYNLSFWAKQISSGPGYVQNYRVAFLSSGGGIVGDGGFQGLSGSIGVWEKKTQNNLIAPVGAVSAQILIQGLTGAFSGSMGEVLIDDVSLESTGAGTVTVLAATAAPAAEISWESTTGFTYNVGSSIDLNGFSPFSGPFAGDNTIQRVYDSPLVTKKFYQVSEE